MCRQFGITYVVESTFNVWMHVSVDPLVTKHVFIELTYTRVRFVMTSSVSGGVAR